MINQSNRREGSTISAYSGVLLVSSEELFILQRRENRPSISNPGQVSTFGGMSWPGESPIECALREVQEEVSLSLKPDDLQVLYTTSVAKQDALIYCSFFFVRQIDPSALLLLEGEGIELLTSEEFHRHLKITPLCRQACLCYLEIKKQRSQLA